MSYNSKENALWYNLFFQSLLTGQLDAGVHPAVPGLGGLPYYDTFDMSAVDILLISQ
jgi:hypothetical protein